MGVKKDRLIHLSDIKEEMVLIDGSVTDYITRSGEVYKDYGNNMFYKKKIFQNKYNKYMYVNITFGDGVNRVRRQHILMAKAFIQNPDPIHLRIVGHKDDVKWHNTLDNLYWTDNQENTQSAFDNGLKTNKLAEYNDSSSYVKVLDKDTLEIAGVYGSICECARRINGVNKSYIAKMCKKGDIYKPKSRRYIYQIATEEEFNNNSSVKNAELIENDVVDKTPKVFYLINDSIGYKKQFDNQKQASKVCNIPQATISKMIKTGYQKCGWRCDYIETIKYSDSSAYDNMVNSYDDIIIENIYTGEQKIYRTGKELSNYFGLNGHDVKAYYDTQHLIKDEWRMIGFKKAI